ncbi:protein FAM200C-like [Clavelina lepadiformis]|uniref:protein FAM200C-like n=1 Tax=Clavelina lepadiformis TaxID=159417 RepID=UPI004041A7F9
MSGKKRNYDQSYLKYGFTDATENGKVIASSECFHQSSSAEVVEASFEIAHMIAEEKKPHNIGETLIKWCMLKAVTFVLGETSSKKIAKIPLSDSTIKTRTDELAKDIEIQVLEKIHASPFFAIQCDETTDVAQSSQLLVYVRFVGSSSIEEEMLFCRPLETTTKAEDVFKVVATYFDNNGIEWEKLVGVCTDGAPAMLGSRSGFIARMKQKSPNAVGCHCVIHREALASRTLSAAMKNKLAIIIQAVNFVKTSGVNTRLFAKLCKDMDSEHETLLFHTSVRWLSKGNMLARVYEMRDELQLFLEANRQQDLLLPFSSGGFQLALAYLADIFQALNSLNLLLQGKNTNRINDYDAIHGFVAKLGLWHRRVQKGNAASFPNLDTALDKKGIELEGELKTEVETHLHLLKQEFERYFPDLGDTELPEWKITRNPFRLNEDILSDDLQEEFLEMKCNSTAKDDFEAMPLTDIWEKYWHIYNSVGYNIVSNDHFLVIDGGKQKIVYSRSGTSKSGLQGLVYKCTT